MKYKIINAGKAKQQTKIKALIYGDSGAGKSFLAATAPKPLFLLTELNGQASIMHSNPGADIIHIDSAMLLAEILRDISDNPDNWAQYDTIVIDSFTEMQRLIRDQLTNGGKTQMKLQDWGKLADSMRSLARRIRNLQKNIVGVCLLETNIDETSGERHLKPAFDGKKTGGEIAQYFNFVGLLYTQTSAKEQNGQSKTSVSRSLMVEGPSRIMCKPCYPLQGIIKNPNLTEIFTAIKGAKK